MLLLVLKKKLLTPTTKDLMIGLTVLKANMPLKPQWCKKIFDVSSSYISVTTESFNNLKIYFKAVSYTHLDVYKRQA